MNADTNEALDGSEAFDDRSRLAPYRDILDASDLTEIERGFVEDAILATMWRPFGPRPSEELDIETYEGDVFVTLLTDKSPLLQVGPMPKNIARDMVTDPAGPIKTIPTALQANVGLENIVMNWAITDETNWIVLDASDAVFEMYEKTLTDVEESVTL